MVSSIPYLGAGQTAGPFEVVVPTAELMAARVNGLPEAERSLAIARANDELERAGSPWRLNALGEPKRVAT